MTEISNGDGRQFTATGSSTQFNIYAPPRAGSSQEEASEKAKEKSEDEIRKNRAWLLGSRIETRYKTSCLIRQPGTCEWIFEKDEFKRWRSSSSSSSPSPKIFWIKGEPGFGKTILCARIIENITQKNEAVAAYFFSSDVENKKDPMVVMRSWIYHLSSQNKSIAKIVNQKRENGSALQLDIIELFHEAIKLVPDCTLVIDGLEECTPDKTYLTVANFMKKVNEAVRDTNIRILVTSRSEEWIRKALLEIKCAPLSEHKVDESDIHSDIEKLSKAIVAEKLRDEDKTIQDEMAKNMSAQSKGQFLWLRMQRDSLSEGLSRLELQKAIEEMPTTLLDLYNRSFEIIKRRKQEAVVLLRLVVFSFRPLTTREISEAILVCDDFHDSQVHELLAQLDEKTFKEEILDLCGSLLVTRKQRPDAPFEEWTIHPVHSTVKEYYLRYMVRNILVWSQLNQSDSVWIAEEHSSLAGLCIKYMSNSYPRRKFVGNARPSKNSFINYAAEFWFQHNEAAADQKKMSIDRFFDENTMWWCVWMKWFDLANDGWANAKSDRDPAIPLCYMIKLGYVDLAITMIKKGVDRVNYSSNGRTALGVACSKGYENLAQTLLTHGAKVGIRDVYGRTAVYYAALNGHAELVRLLIDNGADINTRDYNGASPLLAASSNGHLSIMRQLIQKDANIHVKDKDGNDALFKASSNGHLNAARVLIMRNAHQQLSDYATTLTIPPIFVALKGSSSDLARLLIEKEKDRNVQVGIKRLTILHVAIWEGKIEIAKLLIDDSKANLELQDADGRTPLFVACSRGHTEIVKLLIEKNVDVKTPDNDNKSPLYAACVNRHLEIATLLIAHGADANASDKVKAAPLSGAILGGSFDVVKKITECIKKAADVSVDIRNDAILAVSQKGDVNLLQLLIHWIGYDISKMGYEWVNKENSEKGSAKIAQTSNIKDTALLLASGVGNADVVDLLLRNDADHKSCNPLGQTALYAACCNGHYMTARLLIERGADIRATEKEGHTPLMAACAKGNLDLVKLLLEKAAVASKTAVKAFVNATNKSEMAAAFAAARYGHLEVLRLLILNDADIFHKDVGGLLPIHAASQNGHSKIVEFLIERGSDVATADNQGRTPLWLASSNNRIDVVNVLLKHGVDIDARDSVGKTPLLIASFEGHLKMAKLLLFNCANIKTKDEDKQTPLLCASAQGHLDVVKLLLDHGADMTSNKEGQMPAYVASANGHVDVLRFLIESGADVTTTDNKGYTLLHASCFSGRVATTELLLEMEADINACNSEGFRPLYSASEKRYVAVVNLLLLKKADSFRGDTRGSSLITEACLLGHTETVKLLIREHDVKAEKPDSNGLTPLVAACGAGHVNTVLYLINRGVDVNGAANGITPFEAAQSKGYETVMELLVARGANKGVIKQNQEAPKAPKPDDSETPKLSNTK